MYVNLCEFSSLSCCCWWCSMSWGELIKCRRRRRDGAIGLGTRAVRQLYRHVEALYRGNVNTCRLSLFCHFDGVVYAGLIVARKTVKVNNLLLSMGYNPFVAQCIVHKTWSNYCAEFLSTISIDWLDLPLVRATWSGKQLKCRYFTRRITKNT